MRCVGFGSLVGVTYVGVGRREQRLIAEVCLRVWGKVKSTAVPRGCRLAIFLWDSARVSIIFEVVSAPPL